LLFIFVTGSFSNTQAPRRKGLIAMVYNTLKHPTPRAKPAFYRGLLRCPQRVIHQTRESVIAPIGVYL
jgi:hypothetical protein